MKPATTAPHAGNGLGIESFKAGRCPWAGGSACQRPVASTQGTPKYPDILPWMVEQVRLTVWQAYWKLARILIAEGLLFLTVLAILTIGFFGLKFLGAA